MGQSLEINLSESDRRFIAESFDRLRRLPPPKPVQLEAMTQCACRKLVPLSKACRVIRTSKGIDAIDPVCQGCTATYADQTRYVCVCCKTVIGFTEPGRLPNGFVLPKGGTVHASWCQTCHPEEGMAYMLERFFFDARNKRISGLEFNRIRAHIERVITSHVTTSDHGGNPDPRQKSSGEEQVQARASTVAQAAPD